MSHITLKSFPFSLNGIQITQIVAGIAFPPQGYSVDEKTLSGLVGAGYIAIDEKAGAPAEAEINRHIIAAIDIHLNSVSEDDLRKLIARRGEPAGADLGRSDLVLEAKAQMAREFEGAKPPVAIETAAQAAPVAEPANEGQAGAPPQAKQPDGGDGAASGGETSESSSDWKSEAELNAMNKAELEAYAAEKKVDISQAKTKPEYVEALKPKAPQQ